MDFITGATGIVGRELVSQLISAGHTVKALYRNNSDVTSVENLITSRSLSLDRLIWVEGELNDSQSLESSLKGCTRVFHVAALVSFHPLDEASLLKTNVEGTKNIVNAMLHKDVKTLVYVSSVAALGRQENKIVDEETPFEDGVGETAYSRSKYLAELEVWRGQEEGLSVAVVNPSIIIGAGDFTRSSAELFPQIHAGLSFYPTGSSGYVSSSDVAKACVLLADNNVRGERVLLNSENRSYKSLMCEIAIALNVKPPFRAVKPWMSSFAWRAFWLIEKLTGKRALATKSSLKMSRSMIVYDGSKIERVLALEGVKWEYEPVNKAISRTAESYLASISS